MRLLDDTLKLAKLRSNNPKKYIPLAITMLKDRLKSSNMERRKKHNVRFAYTLETLLMATNDEPALIKEMLKKRVKDVKSQIKSDDSSKSVTVELDSLQPIKEETNENIDVSVIDSNIDIAATTPTIKMFIDDKYRQILPTIDESVEFTMLSTTSKDFDNTCHEESTLSNDVISHIGLTVAQLVVLLLVGRNQEPFELSNIQIEQ